MDILTLAYGSFFHYSTFTESLCILISLKQQKTDAVNETSKSFMENFKKQES